MGDVLITASIDEVKLYPSLSEPIDQTSKTEDHAFEPDVLSKLNEIWGCFEPKDEKKIKQNFNNNLRFHLKVVELSDLKIKQTTFYRPNERKLIV